MKYLNAALQIILALLVAGIALAVIMAAFALAAILVPIAVFGCLVVLAYVVIKNDFSDEQ